LFSIFFSGAVWQHWPAPLGGPSPEKAENATLGCIRKMFLLLLSALLLFAIGFALLFLFSFGCAWPPFRHAFITQVEVSIGFQFCHLLFAI